jgi:hypothetical protein
MIYISSNNVRHHVFHKRYVLKRKQQLAANCLFRVGNQQQFTYNDISVYYVTATDNL